MYTFIRNISKSEEKIKSLEKEIEDNQKAIENIQVKLAFMIMLLIS